MKAEIMPLDGKYYGTKIHVKHRHGEFSFKVWFSGDFTPSARELGDWSVEDWKDADMGCDGHFESQDCYEICELIVDALNGLSPE